MKDFLEVIKLQPGELHNFSEEDLVLIKVTYGIDLRFLEGYNLFKRWSLYESFARSRQLIDLFCYAVYQCPNVVEALEDLLDFFKWIGEVHDKDFSIDARYNLMKDIGRTVLILRSKG